MREEHLVEQIKTETAPKADPGILHMIAINKVGGAEKLLLSLLPALAKEGMSIQCLVFYQPQNENVAKGIGEELRKSGIAVAYKSYRAVYDPGVLSFIASFIRRRQPHLVHAHLKHVEIWLAVLKKLNQIKAPVITTLHGYRDEYHNEHGLTWKEQEKKGVYYRLTRFILKQFAGAISISQGIANFFTSAGLISRNKLHIVHHGTTAQGEWQAPINGEKYSLAIVGRLVKFKGHQYAIEAVEVLRKKYPAVHLHIFGDGPLKPELQALVAQRSLQSFITFHGFVENISAALQHCSVSLVPSIGEPFGLVFFDAFKAGLPVVAFDAPAGNEIIQHGVNGLLAEAGNSASLAAQVAELFTNNDLYNQLSRQAFQVVKTRFTIEEMAGRYAAFYKEIVYG